MVADAGVPPRVSVLMPVYNTGRYLREAIRSVVDQRFRDWELIVIDDGSSDDSAGIAAQQAAEDPRIRCISRENRGVIATRNELIELARGELIAWMDSDDIADPARFEAQVAFLDAEPDCSCVGSFARQIDPDGRRLGCERYPVADDAIKQEQRNGGGLRFPTVMMRRQAAIDAGPFREPFRIGEDFDFLLRVGEQGRLANIPAELYLYRQHPGSAVAQLGAKWIAYRDAILALADQRAAEGSDALQRGERLDLAPQAEAGGGRREAAVYRDWAVAVYRDGRPGESWRYLRRALTLAPLDRAGWKLLAKILLRKV